MNKEQGETNGQARIILAKLLSRHFNLHEIRTLCFELDIKFDDLGGDVTLDAKVQELIDYMDRRLLLYELVEALKRQRPKVTWPTISQQTEPISYDPVTSSNDFDNVTSSLATGFTDLDELTGGLQRSTLNVVAGCPGMGKSSFVTTLAQVVSRRYNQPVVFFNLQLTNYLLRNRLLAMNTSIDLQRLIANDLSQHETEIYGNALEMLSNAPLYLIDDLKISFSRMVEVCKRYSVEQTLGLIVVDGIEHLWSESFTPDLDVQQLVSARWFQYLARTFNVPTVVTLQVGYQVEERRNKRPQLRDIPGDWSFIADSVMALYRDDYYHSESDRPNFVEVSILKNRNGPFGTIDLFWYGKSTMFRNLHRMEFEL